MKLLYTIYIEGKLTQNLSNIPKSSITIME